MMNNICLEGDIIHHSLLITHYSLFIIHYSLFIFHLCKGSARRAQSSLLEIAEPQPIFCKGSALRRLLTQEHP